jgi:hypothetical protein
MIGIIGLWGRSFGKGPHRFPVMVVDDEDTVFDHQPPVRVSVDQDRRTQSR